MARLTAPLLSLGASGTIGKAITFSNWKGIPYARTRVVPANPNSTAQQEVRGVFATLNEMWKRMPAQARLPWDYAVRGLPLTARNRWIQVNLPLLKDDANLHDLLLSVASGQAIPTAAIYTHNDENGTINVTETTAPDAPVGYTLDTPWAFAVLDGDPSPVLTRKVYAWELVVAGRGGTQEVDVDGVYVLGVVEFYTRDSDGKAFAAAPVMKTTTVTTA